MRELSDMQDREWRSLLTAEQFAVTRRGATEPASTGRYCDFDGIGVYRCVCCGNALFSSEMKRPGKSPWPVFWAPAARENIRTAREILHFLIRTEVLCSYCDAHLGYVFNDRRSPTGVRYLINSCALLFVGGHSRSYHTAGPAARRQNASLMPAAAVPA